VTQIVRVDRVLTVAYCSGALVGCVRGIVVCRPSVNRLHVEETTAEGECPPPTAAPRRSGCGERDVDGGVGYDGGGTTRGEKYRGWDESGEQMARL
jgi:hypothetical protein